MTDQSRIYVHPEAFLKGPASGGDLVFAGGLPEPCRGTPARPGERVILLVAGRDGALSWPSPERVYRLVDGAAQTTLRGDTSTVPESEFLATLRSLTNQYAVPAGSGGDGAGIDWVGTVLPVAGALVAVFVVGLFLMRIWHRIDPS